MIQTVVKRDGRIVGFNEQKIMAAVRKAMLHTDKGEDERLVQQIADRIGFVGKPQMTVEDIQNQVETALMSERYYRVAKSYILYRQKHLEDREVRDKLTFLMNYCDAKNAATGSKFDANANVEHKNIATLIGELPKQNFIRLNRRLLTDRLKEMYGKELSDKYTAQPPLHL